MGSANDDTRDIDSVILMMTEISTFFSAIRQGLHCSTHTTGNFEALPSAFPENTTEISASAVGDYNNDGFLDVYASSDQGPQLYLNQGNNQFIEDQNLSQTRGSHPQSVSDALFFDVDNDGTLISSFLRYASIAAQ